MIRPILSLAMALFGCAVPIHWARAETVHSGLIPSSVAERHGLERAWFTQLRLTPGRERVESMRLQVSSEQAQTIFRVITDLEQTFEFSEHHLNALGVPLGVEGAERAAQDQVRLQGLRGVGAKYERQVVPDITLYAITQTGTVHAIDAETGSMRWVTNVGHAKYPTSSPAVTDRTVVVINGQTLYVLDAKSGSILREIRVTGVPAAAPAIVGRTVFIPLINGQLSAYSVGLEASSRPEVYWAKGLVEFSPTAAGNLVVWPTDAGLISAISARRQGVLYRVRLPDPIAGPLIYCPPRQLLAVTRSGYLCSLDVTNGQMMWQYSSGDDIGEPASVVGGTVYMMSRRAGVRAVSADQGQEKWWAPHAERFVAATESKVYAVTSGGQLIVLDAGTGGTIGRIPLNPTDHVFINNQTDRIYIGDQSGVLQCLRERVARWPTIHAVGHEEPPTDSPSDPTREPVAPSPDQTRDPFAGEGETVRELPVDPF